MPIATAAPSAGCTRRAFLTPRTSSPTPIPRESRRCKTGSRSARSTIAPSTRTWSACRPTTRCGSRGACSKTRTGRCSTSSRASMARGSSCPAPPQASPTASSSPDVSSASPPPDRSGHELRLQPAHLDDHVRRDVVALGGGQDLVGGRRLVQAVRAALVGAQEREEPLHALVVVVLVDLAHGLAVQRELLREGPLDQVE